MVEESAIEPATTLVIMGDVSALQTTLVNVKLVGPAPTVQSIVGAISIQIVLLVSGFAIVANIGQQEKIVTNVWKVPMETQLLRKDVNSVIAMDMEM